MKVEPITDKPNLRIEFAHDEAVAFVDNLAELYAFYLQHGKDQKYRDLKSPVNQLLLAMEDYTHPED